MSEEILINVTPQETRIAFIENGSLQEIAIERQRSRGIVSNIYKGRVSRVLPGMEAAFIDIGLERAAFLHVSDLNLSPEEKQSGVETTPPQIQAILRAGQELLVQVIKEPLGTKGARLTSEITIPSRYLVYLPSGRNIGVSSRIEDEDERRRLKGVLQEAQAEHRVPGGFIVRTAAEGADNESLRRDMLFLHKLWSDIAQRAQPAAAGRLVHEDLPIVLRTLRDLVGGTIEKVRIDSREAYHRAAHFAERMEPELLPMLEHYTGERPIFELYNVEEEIQRALERKVPLKSGGYLIIDQTEAMTTVDVNTGGYVGHRTLEETIFKTNLEAAQSIARQLRLRNLGGIIIIDFIDMREAGHREQVMKALQKALERDHAKTKVMRGLQPRPDRDDPQAHPRESGACALPGLPDLRRARRHQDGGDRLLRGLPRDPPPRAPVRRQADAGAGRAIRDRPPAGRGLHRPGRVAGLYRGARAPAGRGPVYARAIRHRPDLSCHDEADPGPAEIPATQAPAGPRAARHSAGRAVERGAPRASAVR